MKKSVSRMRFLSFHVIVGALLFVIAISAAGPVLALDLGINDPLLEWETTYPYEGSYDFGSVALGTSRTSTFRLESIGSSDVSVYIIFLNDIRSSEFPAVKWPPWGDSSAACFGSFCFNPYTWSTLPAILPPDESLMLDVIFTPLSLGEQSAYLGIRSNDTYPPPGSVGYINLEGTGVEAPVPEPATMLLLASGLVGLAGLRRKFIK